MGRRMDGPFEITACDGRARAGVIHTAHGDIRTPAFVPLATKATIKTLLPAEVAALVYGIVQGGIYHDLRVESAETIAGSACEGIAIGGSLGGDKAQMYEVVDWTTAALPEDRPRHLLGIGEIDDLIRGVELGIDSFDCAMPTRLGRHGMVLVPDPAKRWRVDLGQARWKDSDAPLMEGCPCPACALGLTRGYLRYLAHARELTGMRLFTLHNLAFVERVMRRLREAIGAGTLAQTAEALREGAAP